MNASRRGAGSTHPNDVIENWRRARRFDRFIQQYAALLIVMIAVISASVSALLYLDDQAKRIIDLRLDTRQLLQLQQDQVTGVRGYDVTSDQNFLLRPYLEAREPLAQLVPSVASRVEKNSQAAQALRDFAQIHERWEQTVARTIVSKPNDPKNTARERAGDALMNAAKSKIDTVDQLYARKYDQIRALRFSIRYVSTSVVMAAILMIAWIAYVTDRKNLKREESLLRTIVEERDEEARRSEWRTKLIAMLAHDFRSSLGVIRAYADFLESFPDKRDDSEAYDAIRKSVESLTAMSDEALLMARLSNDALNLQLSPQPIYDIVSEAAARYRDERDIRISASSELVMGDRPYLARVFDNLLSNAVKYSSPPSPIGVTIERRGESDIEIAVSDRGAGIAADDIPLVFQEFWRAQGTSERSGSGVGLFIVRKIVEAHGGTATIESILGEGTTVRVVLRAATASRPPARNGKNAGATGRREEVDDMYAR